MPYDLFISYAHNDNRREQVRELRDAILGDFHKFAGRELNIFFDEDEIRSMADWEDRIGLGLRESRLSQCFRRTILPAITAAANGRNTFATKPCANALAKASRQSISSSCTGLDGPGVEQSIAAAVDEMRKRQWCDLASQKPVKIVQWHDAGKRALEDAHVAERLQTLKGEIKERLSRADRARQSPTNTYRHNPQFVGRVRELTLLREALNERGSVGVVGHTTQPAASAVSAAAVHGLGGMGKTELALAYAHAFAWDYPGGRWLARCEGLDNPMLKPDSEPAADTPWQQLVDSLLSLRLLQPGGDVQVVRMHRLVQELMRKGAADAVPFETALLAHVKSRAEFLWEGWVQHEHRWELGPLVACAWLWMERGVQEGAYLANLANGPLLAQLLKATNRLQEAEPLMRRALEIDESELRP